MLNAGMSLNYDRYIGTQKIWPNRVKEADSWFHVVF